MYVWCQTHLCGNVGLFGGNIELSGGNVTLRTQRVITNPQKRGRGVYLKGKGKFVLLELALQPPLGGHVRNFVLVPEKTDWLSRASVYSIFPFNWPLLCQTVGAARPTKANALNSISWFLEFSSCDLGILRTLYVASRDLKMTPPRGSLNLSRDLWNQSRDLLNSFVIKHASALEWSEMPPFSAWLCHIWRARCLLLSRTHSWLRTRLHWNKARCLNQMHGSVISVHGSVISVRNYLFVCVICHFRICAALLIFMCDMTHLYMWHDAFICVTRLIHMRRDSFICVTRLI